MAELLEIRALTKRFGGVVATDEVSLDVRSGEVLSSGVRAGDSRNVSGKRILLNRQCRVAAPT